VGAVKITSFFNPAGATLVSEFNHQLPVNTGRNLTISTRGGASLDSSTAIGTAQSEGILARAGTALCDRMWGVSEAHGDRMHLTFFFGSCKEGAYFERSLHVITREESASAVQKKVEEHSRPKDGAAILLDLKVRVEKGFFRSRGSTNA
jgi:hypothetical protein